MTVHVIWCDFDLAQLLHKRFALVWPEARVLPMSEGTLMTPQNERQKNEKKKKEDIITVGKCPMTDLTNNSQVHHTVGTCV